MFIRIFVLTILPIFLCAEEKLITPIPLEMNVDKRKASLGKKLFFDTQLSRDRSIACVNCHNLSDGGDDNLPVSFGFKGQTGTRNSPTVYNAVFNFRQFWDGRAKDLQEQALGPVENPVEMAHDFKQLIPQLKKTEYRKEFDAIYSDGITRENVANAIAEYEKTLITPNAPFDRYLQGEKGAISPDAEEGYLIFKSKGCILCHQGINIGGSMYNKFGVYVESNVSDLGRYEVTRKSRDKHFFKVPSLRNIERTAPYFHDGHEPDLRKAVLTMSEFQLGRKMTQQEIDKILAFLHTLNGEIPQNIEP